MNGDIEECRTNQCERDLVEILRVLLFRPLKDVVQRGQLDLFDDVLWDDLRVGEIRHPRRLVSRSIACNSQDHATPFFASPTAYVRLRADVRQNGLEDVRDLQLLWSDWSRKARTMDCSSSTS